MIDLVGRWRGLEQVVRDRGLDWGLNYAPADLRYVRSASHPHGGRVEHLLPDDYRAFVAEVGYPVLGFALYDRLGISFLPPEAMVHISVDLPDPDEVWPDAVAGEPTVCRHAFYAGSDLSDLDGYSFGPGSGGGEPVVWLVEGGMPREECGGFTEWLDGEITRLAEHATTFEPAPPAKYDHIHIDGDDEDEDDGEEPDPHRLLDYSLWGDYGQPPYSAADLGLSWVESDEMSYTYGLIDAAGTWLIPLGDRFREVQPFRDGVAKVRLNTDDYDAPWTTIRPDGSIVLP
jgi:hypothetical protein